MRYICYSLYALLICCRLMAQPLPDLIPYNDNGKWGYADTTGRVVIAPQWDRAFFFKGDRALVTFSAPGKPHRSTFCIIDKSGSYIISPRMNWVWNAEFHGLKSPLNCADSNGRWGLIDEDNNQLIPFMWDAPGNLTDNRSDSFKTVAMDGYAGIINRRNELILPCKYADVIVQQLLYDKLRAFIVADPDNRGGNNKLGVVSEKGTTVLPMQYASIKYEEHENRKGFRVTIAANNDNIQYQYPHQNQVYTEQWISYPSMKQEIAPPAIHEQEAVPEQRVDNYILRGHPGYYQLTDTNRKAIKGIERIERLSGDTIVQRTDETHGDSLIITRTARDIHTLMPLSAPEQKTIYMRPREYDHPRSFVCGNGARAWSEGQSSRAAQPSLYVEGLESKEFFKDSMFYSTVRIISDDILPLTNREQKGHQNKHWRGITTESDNSLYLVTGSPRNSGWGYYCSIVDKELNYIVPPIARKQIIAYNSSHDMITVQGSHDNYYEIINGRGQILYSGNKLKLLGGFRWHSRLYICIPTPNTPFTAKVNAGLQVYVSASGTSQTSVKVADTAGNTPGYWQSYNIISMLPAALAEKDTIGFWAMDTTELLTALNPDGELICPALSGKYRNIEAIGNGWYYVTDNNNQSGIVDSHNNPIIPGMISITKPQPTALNFSLWVSRDQPHPGLFSAMTSVSYNNFYIDRYGRAYTSIAGKPGKENKKRKKK